MIECQRWDDGCIYVHIGSDSVSHYGTPFDIFLGGIANFRNSVNNFFIMAKEIK